MDTEVRIPRRMRRVSASELAQMEVCERRVLLQHRHGVQPTRAQTQARRRGLRLHRRFHLEREPREQREGRPRGWLCLRSVLARLIDAIRALLPNRRGRGGRR